MFSSIKKMQTHITEFHTLEKNNTTNNGFLLKALVDDPYFLHPNEIISINTRIYPQFIKSQTIYKSEIRLSLQNCGKDSICIFDGMKLGQIVFSQLPKINCSVQ